MGYAYVASVNDDSLVVWDVTDPSAPVPVGVITGAGFPNFLDQAGEIDKSGDYVYVCAQNDASLTIVDVSNPAAPAHAGVVTDAVLLNRPSGVQVYDWTGLVTIAYVVAYSGDCLVCVDVSIPAFSAIVGSIAGAGAPNFLDGPTDIHVVGNFTVPPAAPGDTYAYVTAAPENSLTIIDVSDTTNPTFVGNISGAGAPNYLQRPNAVRISGNYAYVLPTLGDAGLTVIDVSNPAAPAYVTRLAGAGAPNYLSDPVALEIAGNYAYIAARGDMGLTIVDISNPAAPATVGHVTCAWGIDLLNNIRLGGSRAYITVGEVGD